MHKTMLATVATITGLLATPAAQAGLLIEVESTANSSHAPQADVWTASATSPDWLGVGPGDGVAEIFLNVADDWRQFEQAWTLGTAGLGDGWGWWTDGFGLVEFDTHQDDQTVHWASSRVQSVVEMRDLRFKGPEPTVEVTMLLEGYTEESYQRNAGVLTDQRWAEGNVNVAITVNTAEDGSEAGIQNWDGHYQWQVAQGSDAVAETSSGLLEGWHPGENTFYDGTTAITFTAPTTHAITLTLAFETDVSIEGWGEDHFVHAQAGGGMGMLLGDDGEAFVLPDGYTAHAPASWLHDNRFVPIPEPATAGPVLAGFCGWCLWGRRRVG